MLNFWDERYSAEEFIYGTEPNEFLKSELNNIKPGRILLPADGEARNGVYAASLGWDVVSFDSSIEAQKKGLNLAKLKNVHINYILSSFEDFEFEKNYFDVLALTFVHLPSNKSREYHQKFLSYLKPGGTIILEAFSKEQINFNTGGPKDLDLLYSESDLFYDFESLSDLSVTRQIVNLKEGDYHSGESSVIRLIGKK